jgi:2-methylcitrate dehydratase PrpD
MDQSITTEVVDFLSTRKDIPTSAKRKAVDHLIDGIGVMLAGSRGNSAKKLIDYVEKKNCIGKCTIIGSNHTSSSTEAALVNGTSGHADDYDDTQLSTSPDRIYGLLTHPTVPVLAASLAVGEETSCTGKQLLDAFITGFEVECKIAEAINPEHYKRGFHTTGTIGAFGACAASSRLLELKEEQLRYAIGITASMSSGIRANFGTMTKPLHAGRAASNGVTAATLAKIGFTADENALDGKWGFMNILGGGAEPEKIVDKLGNPYSIVTPGASIKMYPCGSLGQPSMDALLEIVSENDLKPDDVREIRLRAGRNILEPLRYEQPEDDLQAKFSLQFGLSSILLRRRAGLREYTKEYVNSPEVRETMGKVKTILDPKIEEMGTDKMRSALEVELRNGRTFRRFADTARGTTERPLREAELDEKFRDCANCVLDEVKIGALLKLIRNVEDLTDVKQITELLRA